VFVHQAKSQRAGVKTPERQRNDIDKRLPVNVIIKNGLASIAARSDVIDRAGKFDAQGSGHGDRLGTEGGKRQGLTLCFAEGAKGKA
jgi:hypothetical protein